jgi:hypothetical protein
VETVQAGWNTLVDLDANAALAALERQPPAEHPALYGDGHAAERCVEAIGRLGERVGAGNPGSADDDENAGGHESAGAW